MPEIFSEEWMRRFMQEWNNEGEMTGPLHGVEFDSVIGYGYREESKPRACVVVRQGKVTAAGPFRGEPLDWDLRASADQWRSWQNDPPGLVALGMAYASGKLQFLAGDYVSMVKNPAMAGPFVKSFEVMSRV
jgi:hypothetical protein